MTRWVYNNGGRAAAGYRGEAGDCVTRDGVIRDTHDPSRDGTRCVYGYWTAEPGQ